MCPSFLDSGLRRNDNGVLFRLVYNGQAATRQQTGTGRNPTPPASFRRKPESSVYIIHSGLLEAGQNDYSSFCFKGKGTDRPDLTDTHPTHNVIPACAGMCPSFLDSGLRRNDNGVLFRLVYNGQAVTRQQTGKGRNPTPPASFRRRPESSGLCNTFRPAGGRPE